ncbi:MAG TPA: ATP-binding protein, partial [Vicinamibacteria bacterium]
MFFPRAMSGACRVAAEQFPVLLLTGPRQVGKTTLLQHLAERSRRYVTLDDPAVRVLAKEDPSLFLERFEAPVLIDEIQYAPELLPVIKILVDRQKKPGLVWLTGSQQFQLMRGISETLAGRVAILSLLGFSNRERYRLPLDLPPFVPSARELKRRERSAVHLGLKKVYRDIWTGSFPALVAGPVRDRDLFYSSYLQTYLQRDVKDLTQVGDESAFLRFLKACAARTAQMLNLTDLARDADVAVNTAK